MADLARSRAHSDIRQFHHIKSHEQCGVEEAWLQWACSANDMADAVADDALDSLHFDILARQREAVDAIHRTKQLVQHVHAHLVRVARMTVVSKEPDPPVTRVQVHSEVIEWKLAARKSGELASDNLKFPQWMCIFEWMQRIECKAQEICRSWRNLSHLIRLQYPEFKPHNGRPWVVSVRCLRVRKGTLGNGSLSSLAPGRSLVRLISMFASRPSRRRTRGADG